MDTAPDAPEQDDSTATDHPVLIVENGRLSGTRRTLTVPLTLVGRKKGCDIRLNVDGVSALHCVLVAGPDGLFVRDLQSTSGTFVNEERVPNRVLHNGDIVGIGPFQFRVHIPKPPNPQAAGAEAGETEDEEALRVQVAAVAAQQAALTELESHLQRRKVALDQQEAQLAGHLEDKRRRLVELRDEVRHGHGSLKQERAAHEAQMKELLNGLEAARQEATEAQQQAQAERRRLVDLRVHLKRRWHRHWAGERAALKHRLAGIDQQQRRLESEAERLRHARAKLDAAWARFNGEAELGRRQLQAAWDALRQEKRQWQEMRGQETADLDQRSTGQAQREAALLEIQQELTAERRHWERRRLALEKEAEGLESRIRNQRRKLLDQEQEVARREPVIPALEARVERKKNATGEDATAEFPTVPFAFPVSIAETAGSDAALSLHQEALAAGETELQDRLESLEKLSEELADQRLQLAEQFQHLVEVQQHWQHEHEKAAAELHDASRRLQEQEQALQTREQALEPTESRLWRQQADAAHLRLYLAGWQARLASRQANWEADRDRLLADVEAREKLAEERVQLVDRLHAGWTNRRRQAADQVRAEQAAGEELRRECAALHEEWLRRRAVLQQDERALAERTLALEQYRQGLLAQAPDPASADKELRRLRRQWGTQFASATETIRTEQQALQAEAGRLELRYRDVQQQVERVTAQEADIYRRQLTFERDQTLAADKYNKLRQELVSLYAQRTCYERQVLNLQDEVERIACLLLDETDANSPPAVRAA